MRLHLRYIITSFCLFLGLGKEGFGQDTSDIMKQLAKERVYVSVDSALKYINEVKVFRVISESSKYPNYGIKEICKLEKLEYLDLANTSLKGIPNEILNLRNLKILKLPLLAKSKDRANPPISNKVIKFLIDKNLWKHDNNTIEVIRKYSKEENYKKNIPKSRYQSIY